MAGASGIAEVISWYERFVGHLDPGERVGELLFGLIMVLTFTLGAGIELAGDREETRALLIAALGCNAAWGIIDAALYLMARLTERGRLHRLARTIQTTPDRERALGVVASEIDERVPSLVDPQLRRGSCAHSRPGPRNEARAQQRDQGRPLGIARRLLARLPHRAPGRHRANMSSLIEGVTTELEKVRAREQEGSLIPLHYAIRALERGIRKIRRGTVLSKEIESDVQRVAKNVETYLQGKPGRDKGGHIKENLKALRDAYESPSSRGKKTR